MRFISFLGILSIITMSTSAVLADTIIDFDSCAKLISSAEKNTHQDTNVYTQCGFDNENYVWETWAAYVSQKNHKKALFEICVRHPNHMYHNIYCEKSAQLGYGPALAYKAEKLLEQNNFQTAVKFANQAIKTNELNEEQYGRLLEKVGVHLFQQNNPQFQTYLEEAALKQSALANHMLSIIHFKNDNKTEENKKISFQYMWRAILLSCPNAEENLGLFHLERQKKIPYETAVQMMHQKINSCTSTTDRFASTDNLSELFTCQCKSVIQDEKRHQSKPFLLISTHDDKAVLRDKTGQEYHISTGDNLPNRITVSEIRPTAVILTTPTDRIILNRYTTARCASFCHTYHIDDNLTPQEMEKRVMGNVGVKIKPYHLSFTPKECDTLMYYASHLVDTSKPFVGKEECQSKQPEQMPIVLNKTTQSQTQNTPPVVKSDTNDESFSTNAKERLKKLDIEFVD